MLLIPISVDGEVKCEKWTRDDGPKTEESSNIKWLLNSLIGRPEPDKVSVDQAYPFAEGKLFVLTITAGLEGYHVNVDGRHVASFPYRTVRFLPFLCRDCSLLTSIYHGELVI